jgi:hypothetical protein
MKPPSFNPEELAHYKVTVSLDVLYRWAQAIAGASGTITGVGNAFKARGQPLEMLAEEEGHLDEIRREMADKMREGYMA